MLWNDVHDRQTSFFLKADTELYITHGPVPVTHKFCGRRPLSGPQWHPPPGVHTPVHSTLHCQHWAVWSTAYGKKWCYTTLTLGYKRLWHSLCPLVLFFIFSFIFYVLLDHLLWWKQAAMLCTALWKGPWGKEGKSVPNSLWGVEASNNLGVRRRVCSLALAEPWDERSPGGQPVCSLARDPDPEPPCEVVPGLLTLPNGEITGVHCCLKRMS